ncbi:hypothetical protein PG994_000964 [Apiospora phragmitis]|uniref:CHAT domain-containing protein n=1 Tax=Apiospora phragmitis TaxID=2905665 RepID=A0ABR1WR39_9PEZI
MVMGQHRLPDSRGPRIQKFTLWRRLAAFVVDYDRRFEQVPHPCSRLSSETVLDRVISSYSSSIRAIIHSRRPSIATSNSAQALLVAMEYTRGWGSLPSAAKEVAAVRSLCRSMNIQTVEPLCRKAEIKSHLHRSAISHFAGHGCTDGIDPSKSYLCLGDRQTDGGNLTRHELRERSPFSAYLSACGTGRLKVMKFMDENIHLISAFQLAGFRYVIGSLCNVDDDVCVDIARTTYEEISKNRGLEDGAVSRGLHKALRKQRDHWLDKLTVQGPKRESAGHDREWPRDASQMEGKITERDEHWEMPVRKALCRERHRNQREDRTPRPATLCEADNGDNQPRAPLHWVPYVHFGP